MRIYDFPKYPKTQNPKTFASCKLFLKIIYKSLTAHSESSLGGLEGCKLFLKIIYKSLTAHSESSLGGLEGRLERITKNPRADGSRG